jgi:hypothetical protein
MPKKVITIGYQIPGFSSCYKLYSSDQSLLDADIIVFEPAISDYENYYQSSTYQGKDSYDENSSFRLKEDTHRWRNELSAVLEVGKTVFVVFGKCKEIFVHTGKKQYSGTGRNAKTINMVELANNYMCLPITLPPLIPKEGNEIKPYNHPAFTAFWSEFRSYLKYESYIDGNIDTPLFFTKTGQKPVGGLFKVGKGHLVLLPPIRYPDDFTKYNEKEKGYYWTKESLKFGEKLVNCFVDIDNFLRSASEQTPPPTWVSEEIYSIEGEKEVRVEIDEINKKIDKLVENKNLLLNKMREEGLLKNLLYEQGTPLENAIIDALVLLGYKAENYNDGQLEIDQVIVSPGGKRFIGESEGKNNSAIGIDKFRQLESNIQEDLQREEVQEPAIGILFGNGFRLQEPSKRPAQFTEKCLINAKRLGVILIQTSDLFSAAKYFKRAHDKKYASLCREAIEQSHGKIVVFPETPNRKING